MAEVVKSVSCLCDLFCSAAHHRWVLESLIPLHTLHPIEDHITQQYIILASCKALATLRLAKQVSLFSFIGISSFYFMLFIFLQQRKQLKKNTKAETKANCMTLPIV